MSVARRDGVPTVVEGVEARVDLDGGVAVR